VLAVVVLLALAGRLWSASSLFLPDPGRAVRLSGDEMVYIYLGDRLFEGGRYSTLGIERTLPGEVDATSLPAYLKAPVFKHPPVFPFLVGLARWWGGTLAWSFVPAIALAGVGILATFWLARTSGLSLWLAIAPAALVAISPVHWIAGSRVWLDVPLATLITLAVSAQLAAVERPRWHGAAGVLWGLATLTKYTAAIPWAVMAVATRPETPSQRSTWVGGLATGGVLLLPWLFVRLSADGFQALAFWDHPVQDWRHLGVVLRWLPLVAAAGLAGRWLCRRYRARLAAQTTAFRLLVVGTAAYAALLVLDRGSPLTGIPWSGWDHNELATSSPVFYLLHLVTFDPVLWLGVVGSMVVRIDPRLDGVRWAWVALLVFLTLWGNYQSRYGAPLLPLQMILAVALVRDAITESVGTRRLVATGLAGAWFMLSAVRSLWVVGHLALPNDFFYF
jgi:4-amino-4-deoxy-L-arabinose transferase-like glycosyltransferase